MTNSISKNLLCIAATLLLLPSCVGTKVYNITDYGATNDSLTLSTIGVQSAIDACEEDGGGIVLVPQGNYQIGTIVLKSNIELHLEKGGQLLGSKSLADYSTSNRGAIEAPAFDKCLIYAEDATNIKISGEGAINGRGSGDNFPIFISKEKLGDRPMLIRFDGCKQIEFKDVQLRNSASWCTHLVNCEDIVISQIYLHSHVNRNNDGLDLDGCKRVLIEDCTIFSGDDAICPKSTTERMCEDITVRNCRITSNTAAFKCGTSSMGGFKNISVDNCDFSDSRMCAIKLQVVDGGFMENIRISNIKMNNVEGPIFIRLGNRGRLYDKPTEQIHGRDVENEGAKVGIMRNIVISDVTANVVTDKPARSGIMISGIPGHNIEDVVLRNITVSYPGGGTAKDASRVVPEDEARYPELFFFGVLPSWGAYVRHAENITFDNVNLTTRNSDKREEIVTVEVENFKRL